MLYVVYFVSKFCPEKHDAFIFFHTISVIINRLTLQPKGEGCLTTHQSHCNRLVFCKPIELHRYKAQIEKREKRGKFCRPIELHRYKAQLYSFRVSLAFCKPIELHRYKAESIDCFFTILFCKPIELHRYKAQQYDKYHNKQFCQSDAYKQTKIHLEIQLNHQQKERRRKMADEITITRKYVIYPMASDMKEWERKVRKYVSENY